MAERRQKLCNDSHGIDTDRWDVDPHPLNACAELTEMGKHPVTFMDVLIHGPSPRNA